MEIKDYIPKYIKQIVNARPKQVITNERWNELFNLLITQGDYTAEAAKVICDTVLLNDNKHTNREDSLQQAIQDIVNATIPSQSILTDMLVDGAVTKQKIASGVLLDKATNAQGIAGSDTNTIVTPAVLLATLKAKDAFITGAYTGNSSITDTTSVYQTINLGFAPDAVLVTPNIAPYMMTSDINGSNFRQHWAFATKATPAGAGWDSKQLLTLTATGFQAWHNRTNDFGTKISSINTGSFTYIAFRNVK